MTGLLNLRDHLVFYKSYHTDEVNVTIHLICIPIILTSAIAMLTKFSFFNPYINVGNILIASFSCFYILMDWKVGIPTVLFYGGFAYVFSTYFYFIAPSPFSITDQAHLLKYALYIHIVAWLAQFYGHKVHEHRAPALLDNLLGALVLAPYFVSFEVAFWLGFRTDIKEYMEKGAAEKRKQFLDNKKAS